MRPRHNQSKMLPKQIIEIVARYKQINDAHMRRNICFSEPACANFRSCYHQQNQAPKLQKMAQKDTEDTEDAAEDAKRYNFCYLKMRDLLSIDDLSNHLTW